MKRFIILAAVALVGCKSEVTAIYYPDRTNLSKYIAETVASVEACRAWVALQARQQASRGDERRPDYSCHVGDEKVR